MAWLINLNFLPTAIVILGLIQAFGSVSSLLTASCNLWPCNTLDKNIAIFVFALLSCTIAITIAAARLVDTWLEHTGGKHAIDNQDDDDGTDRGVTAAAAVRPAALALRLGAGTRPPYGSGVRRSGNAAKPFRLLYDVDDLPPSVRRRVVAVREASTPPAAV